MIYPNLTSLIGNTPMIELQNIEKALGLKNRVLAKAEMFNPGGSVKDRAALAMIEYAEKEGSLKPGATIIEPTSGNTGIGLAWIGTTRGYRVILTMPETMSIERRKLLAVYGAEIILTPGTEGMKGAIAKANDLLKEIPDSIILGQFDNPRNPMAHQLTTGPEILADTQGNVDYFVAGVGTGGTVTGVGRALKESDPATTIVAVEPASSPVLTGGKAAPHKIQGIGAGFVPANLDLKVVDEIMRVTDDDAFEAARFLARKEGLLAGISSGAALSAAIAIAQRPNVANKTIVVLLPDTGDRYLSTPLFG